MSILLDMAFIVRIRTGRSPRYPDVMVPHPALLGFGLTPSNKQAWSPPPLFGANSVQPLERSECEKQQDPNTSKHSKITTQPAIADARLRICLVAAKGCQPCGVPVHVRLDAFVKVVRATGYLAILNAVVRYVDRTNAARFA